MPRQKEKRDPTQSAPRSARPPLEPPDREHLARADSADAFIPDPEGGPAVIGDDLAESLAEEYVHSATSGEDMAEEVLDQVVSEEIGGPFIETSGDQEFAAGTDESNPPDATQEALPRAVGGLARRPQEEEEE